MNGPKKYGYSQLVHLQIDKPLAVGPVSASEVDTNAGAKRKGHLVKNKDALQGLPGLAVTILGVAVGIAVDTRKYS